MKHAETKDAESNRVVSREWSFVRGSACFATSFAMKASAVFEFTANSSRFHLRFIIARYNARDEDSSDFSGGALSQCAAASKCSRLRAE